MIVWFFFVGIEDHDFHYQQTQAMNFNTNKFWMALMSSRGFQYQIMHG
jgi:hypothetical protein